MTDFLFNAIKSIVDCLGTGGIFVLSVALITAVFIWCLVLSVKRTGYRFYKRLWAMCLFVAIVTGDYGLEKFSGSGMSFNLLLTALALIYTAVLLMIRERKFKSGKNELAFVRRLMNTDNPTITDRDTDYIINKGQIINAGKRKSYADSQLIKTKEICDKSGSTAMSHDEPDFSHINSILERLDNYPLSQVDKYMVESIKKLMKEREKGSADIPESKINDGIGNLLKIMSRYGV